MTRSQKGRVAKSGMAFATTKRVISCAKLTNGDLVFFYHSQSEKAVVGIVSIVAEAHSDSTTDDERWECIDIKAVKPVKSSVTLEMIKADGRLDDMILVRNSRLSVQPVSDAEWDIICQLAEISG